MENGEYRRILKLNTIIGIQQYCSYLLWWDDKLDVYCVLLHVLTSVFCFASRCWNVFMVEPVGFDSLLFKKESKCKTSFLLQGVFFSSSEIDCCWRRAECRWICWCCEYIIDIKDFLWISAPGLIYGLTLESGLTFW